MWRLLQPHHRLVDHVTNTALRRNISTLCRGLYGASSVRPPTSTSTCITSDHTTYNLMNSSNVWERRERWLATISRRKYNEEQGIKYREAMQEVTEENIERIPVPAGIPTDHSKAYVIKDSQRALGTVDGIDSMFVVHGPSEVWAPKGLVKGHGAGGGLFAVFQKSGGFQFKVMEGDVFYTDRIKGDVNSTVVFDDVLLLGAVDWSWFGRPCIRHASVTTMIEEQTRSGKIYVTKFKKRTGYKRRKGHRQEITRFRVVKINYELPDASRFADYVPPIIPHDMPKNFEYEL